MKHVLTKSVNLDGSKYSTQCTCFALRPVYSDGFFYQMLQWIFPFLREYFYSNRMKF